VKLPGQGRSGERGTALQEVLTPFRASAILRVTSAQTARPFQKERSPWRNTMRNARDERVSL
jgi:hypothetical protein